jgi:AraC-like DNA-binding protein/quercetin dioxygenase-like cupin family protein
MTGSAEAWGTLGEPRHERGSARLLHVVPTKIATFRHAFYEAGAIVPHHRHECASLVYGVGGPCIETQADEEVICRRLTFHPAGLEHSLEFLGPAHILAIEIEPRKAGSGDPWRWPDCSKPLPGTFYDQIWRVMLTVAEGKGESSIVAALEDLLAMVEAFERSAPTERILQVIADLHVDWKCVPSVGTLSARYGVSSQHLCRTFKQYLGVTLQQYGLLLRLDYARGLLWGSGLSLSAVAAETGFADQSHLTRVLAAHSDRTPRRLRWTAPCLTAIPDLLEA